MTIQQAIDTALAHQNAGRLDAAEIIYRNILKTSPRNFDALQLLAVIAHMRGKYEHAIELYKRALQVNSSIAAVHCNLAETYRVINKLDESIACLRVAISLDPRSATAYNNLGHTLLNQKKLDEALASVQKALELDPDMSMARKSLGRIYARLGDHEKAAHEIMRGTGFIRFSSSVRIISSRG